MKIIKLFFAALIAASAFCLMACSNPSSSGSSTLDVSKPIFDSGEASNVLRSVLKLTDGDWVYQEIQKGSDWQSVEYIEFTVSENGEKLAFSKCIKWDNEGGSADITGYMKGYEALFKMTMSYTFNKTNSDNTKFYRHDDSTSGDKGPHTVDTYLMKK